MNLLEKLRGRPLAEKERVLIEAGFSPAQVNAMFVEALNVYKRQKPELPSVPKRAAEAMPLYSWMTSHRQFLIPGRGLDFTHHRYLEDIYREEAQQVVIYKSSQMGISEYLLSYALHACDQRDATTLYLFPNDGLISDFSTARLGPALEASEYLQSIVIDSRDGSGKRGADRVTLKRVRDRFLYLRGGQVRPSGAAPQLKSVDADLLIVDELDECDPRVVPIARKRLGHSSIAEVRLVSTPTYAGVGIHAEWLQSDMREWNIPCPHCRRYQHVTIQNVVRDWRDDRPVAWHGMEDDEPFAACSYCHKRLNLLAPGEWASTQRSDIVGYHVTKFFGPALNLRQVIEDLRSYNATTVRETWNQELGEVYSAKGSRMTDEALDECKREYLHGTDRQLRCYMGIDVGRVLNVVIRQAPDAERGERRQLFAGEVNWDEAARLIRQYAPAVVVMDALPETTKARELQSEFGRGLVWLCYYGDTTATNKKADYIQWNDEEGTVLADRTRSLDETYARFYEGSNTLPANAKDIARYYDQMKLLQRVVEERRDGSSVARYVGAGADHYAHAENYAAIASGYVIPAPRKPAQAGVLDY